MSFEKRITEAPSASLAIAICEAIQEHADHYTAGAINSDDRFCALAVVVAEALADIRAEHARNATRRSLFRTIEELTAAKLVADIETFPQASSTPQ